MTLDIERFNFNIVIYRYRSSDARYRALPRFQMAGLPDVVFKSRLPVCLGSESGPGRASVTGSGPAPGQARPGALAARATVCPGRWSPVPGLVRVTGLNASARGPHSAILPAAGPARGLRLCQVAESGIGPGYSHGCLDCQCGRWVPMLCGFAVCLRGADVRVSLVSPSRRRPRPGRGPESESAGRHGPVTVHSGKPDSELGMTRKCVPQARSAAARRARATAHPKKS